MDTDDGELLAWRDQWQRLGAADELARELTERAARDGARMRRAAAGEVSAAALSAALCVWMLVRSRGAPTVVALSLVVLAFDGAWLAQFFGARARLFRASGQSVDAYVELTRARLDAEARWVRIARRWTLALIVVLAPWGAWVAYAQRAIYAAQPWRAVLGFGGAAVIFAGVLWALGRRSRSLDDERRAFEQQLADAHCGGEG